MSQHYYSTTHRGEAINVVLGWDRPLQYYFLIVERCHPKPGQDDYLYLNLDDSLAFELDLPYFRSVLQELGIQVPESMFVQVERDRMQNTGNRLVSHYADGQFAG